MSIGLTGRGGRAAILLAALGFLGSGQAGCSATPRSIVTPRVEVIGLTPLQATPERQRFRVSLLIDNQNTEPLPIQSLRFTLRLAGEGILDGRSAAPGTVEALDRKTIQLEVDSDIVSSLSRLLSFVQGPANSLPYEIYGNLTLDRTFQNTLPFSFSGQVPLSMTGDR
jgi:LEA14-like dessication related protein